MLKNAKQFAEFCTEPSTWCAFVFIGGTTLCLLFQEGSPGLYFARGFFMAGFFAVLPSLFLKSWDNCPDTYRKADRGLAFCEGWERCVKSFDGLRELGAEATEELKGKLVESAFEEGLAYVESGKHMRIR